jgi:hypothetical protein
MKLPNGEHAIVDLAKLIDYCLDPDHPRGKHKARVFESACGFTVANADLMRQQLLDAAERGEAVAGPSFGYGRRYVVEYKMTEPGGEALVRTAWIMRDGEIYPRFVSAYVI